MSRSMDGSSARERNSATFSSTPDSSNELHEEPGDVVLDPHGGEDHGEVRTRVPRIFACRAIWAASSLCGRPLPEKMGSFWPRIRVFIPSMARYPGLDEVAGILPGGGVDGRPLTSSSSSPTVRRPAVSWVPQAVEHPAQHLAVTPDSRRGSPQNRTRVSGQGQPGGAVKDLDDHHVVGGVQDHPQSDMSLRIHTLDQFAVAHRVGLADKRQGALRYVSTPNVLSPGEKPVLLRVTCVDQA